MHLFHPVELKLRRQTEYVYYWKENQEVDFIYIENEATKLINVSYDLSNPQTLNRELKGLLEAMESLNLEKSVLINSEKEEEFHENGKTIQIVPIWKWLLDENYS